MNIPSFGEFTTNTIGLDRLFNEVSKRSINNEPKYPPYNILKLDTYKFMIELAVAGFSRDEISVEFADDVLRIEGSKESQSSFEGRTYMHKGISNRSFLRTFLLSPDVIIDGVALENGLLKILLEREVPENKKSRKFEIKEKLELPSAIPDDQLLVEDDVEKLKNGPGVNTNPPRISEVG